MGWTPQGIPWDSLGPLKSIWVPKLILVLDIGWYWRVAERSERNIVLGIFGHVNETAKSEGPKVDIGMQDGACDFSGYGLVS